MGINNNETLTMKHVERLAVKTLKKYKSKVNRDTVDEVMTVIWRAYTRYNPAKKTKLMTWLIHCARCRIKTLKGRKNRKSKQVMISLDSQFQSGGSWHGLIGKTEFDRLEYNEIIEYAQSDVFTQQQRDIFERVYLGGEEISSIAADLKIGRTNVYNILNGIIERLRWRFAK